MASDSHSSFVRYRNVHMSVTFINFLKRLKVDVADKTDNLKVTTQ
jgi:hypothetical protein